MTPDEALLSVIAGIVSSLLAVLVIEFARALRLRLDQRALRKVLGLHRDVCVISAAAVRNEPRWGLVSQREAHAFAYIANLAFRLGVEPEIIDAKNPSVSQEPTDEFCVGGPLTNDRTREILKRYMTGFEIVLTENAMAQTPDLAKPWVKGFKIDNHTTTLDAERGFAFLGKVQTDFGTTAHVVFGIADLGVAAAAYYLHAHYGGIAQMFGDHEYFILLSYSVTFGYKSVTFERNYSNLIGNGKSASVDAKP